MAQLKQEKNKASLAFIAISLLLIFIILSFLNILVGLSIKNSPPQPIPQNKNLSFFSDGNATRVEMHLPAVDADGKGADTFLIVEATKGSGRTLADIDNLLFWTDTQHSIRIARKVAENITGKKMEDYDIVYSIEANASLIGGPSAGAALAIATIAALGGKKMNENVMITGGINHDGSISPVSSILEKAKAAKAADAAIFLVPLLQSRDVVYEDTEHCEKFGTTEICSTETRPKKVDVAAEAGIRVEEVETIEDAMRYFFD